MSISDLGMLFQFAGGLGMFLYGMNIMLTDFRDPPAAACSICLGC